MVKKVLRSRARERGTEDVHGYGMPVHGALPDFTGDWNLCCVTKALYEYCILQFIWKTAK